MRMTPRVIVKKLIRRWSISSSARCCDRHALLMISWFTTMSQKNVSDNGSDWCSDTTRRTKCPHPLARTITVALDMSKTFDTINTSSQRQFKTGVPLGGILSPKLFNIYTADIPPPRAANKYIRPYIHNIFYLDKTN